MDTHLDNTTVARILVVDDNATMRRAIGLIINNEHDLCVCGEARNTAEAVEQCETLKPDLALVDISLKGEDGLDLVRLFSESAPPTRTVVFSLHDEPFYIDAAREANARGYVTKTAPPQQLVECMRKVLHGLTCFPRPRQP